MSWFSSTYHSRIYRDFRGISEKDFREQIRYFEKFEDDIHRLGFDEFFELLVAYTNALFQVGLYRKFLLMAEVILALSIQHRVSMYKGYDLYRQILFRKAAAHFNLLEYQAAEYILYELIKLNPADTDTILFYSKCRQHQYPATRNYFRAASIFLFLLSAGLVALEILFVRPFFEMYALLVAYSRTTLFFLGCLAMLVGYLYVRWLAVSDTRFRVKEAKQRLASREPD